MFYGPLLFLLVSLFTHVAFTKTNEKLSAPIIGPIEVSIEVNTTTTLKIEEETTTSSIVEETTTIVEEPTTIKARPSPTTTVFYEPSVSSSAGPPRNITSLVGCIAYYESTWGDIDPNVFQFIQGTWEAYGGTGSPDNAPYWKQEEIFWLAWADGGPHHWAAQKGRCF